MSTHNICFWGEIHIKKIQMKQSNLSGARVLDTCQGLFSHASAYINNKGSWEEYSYEYNISGDENIFRNLIRIFTLRKHNSMRSQKNSTPIMDNRKKVP